jgi:hypothetical protein
MGRPTLDTTKEAAAGGVGEGAVAADARAAGEQRVIPGAGLEWRRLEKILCVLELRRQVQELLLLELSRLMKSLLMLDMGWLINRRLLLEMEKMIKDLMLLEELGGLLLGELGLLLDRAWAALLLDRSLGDLIPHAPWHALRPTGSVSDVRIGDAGSKHRRDALLLVWAERCASGHACWEMGVSIPRCRCV